MAVGAVVRRPSPHEGRVSPRRITVPPCCSLLLRGVGAFDRGSACRSNALTDFTAGACRALVSLRPDCQWFARASRHRSGQWRHRPAAWFSLGSCDAHSLRALPNACLLPPHSYSRCISGGGRPTCQALTGVPASDNVRGWRGSIPLSVLPSGPSSSASSSKMVCALPFNSRTLASLRALSACPSRSSSPSDKWCMGCRMRRPSPRPPPPPSPTPTPPAPFPMPSLLPCSCVCGCTCRRPVCEMRTRPNGPSRMASALAACVSALFQPISTRWYVCCRVVMTLKNPPLTHTRLYHHIPCLICYP